MIFLLKYWKYIVVALLIIAAFGGFKYYGHIKYKEGYDTAIREVQEKQEKANEEVRTRKKVIHHETQNLDRAGIVKQLCNGKWVRDAQDCPH